MSYKIKSQKIILLFLTIILFFSFFLFVKPQIAEAGEYSITVRLSSARLASPEYYCNAQNKAITATKDYTGYIAPPPDAKIFKCASNAPGGYDSFGNPYSTYYGLNLKSGFLFNPKDYFDPTKEDITQVTAKILGANCSPNSDHPSGPISILLNGHTIVNNGVFSKNGCPLSYLNDLPEPFGNFTFPVDLEFINKGKNSNYYNTIEFSSLPFCLCLSEIVFTITTKPIPITCGNINCTSGPTDPLAYRCRTDPVKQFTEVVRSYTTATCDEGKGTCTKKTSWLSLNDEAFGASAVTQEKCQGKTFVSSSCNPNNGSAVNSYKVNFCSPSGVNLLGNASFGKCTAATRDDVTKCGGCIDSAVSPNAGCNGRWITRRYDCTQCGPDPKIPAQKACLNNGLEWRNDICCGILKPYACKPILGGDPLCPGGIPPPPTCEVGQNAPVGTTYCAGGTQYQVTMNLPGICDINRANEFGMRMIPDVPICRPPLPDFNAIGPCPGGGRGGGGGGSGSGGSCNTDETQQCPSGGQQVCDANGDWSPCPCPTGQQTPHLICQNGTCSNVTTCGVSSCSALGATCNNICPTGQVNPHLECLNGTCANVNTCGVSSCSPLGATCNNICPTGQVNPRLECLNGTCSNVNTCGVSTCNLLGANCTNQSPYAINLKVNPGSYCTSLPVAIFQWTYGDVERDTESKYELQISTNAEFDDKGLIIDKTLSGLSNSDGTVNKVPIYVFSKSLKNTSDCLANPLDSRCNYINYGEAYYWRVRVWENVTGYDSGLINYVDTHTFTPPNNYNQDGYPNFADDKDQNKDTYTYIYSHHGPSVGFTYPSESVPIPGESIYFQDISNCYQSDSVQPYVCSSLNSSLCTAAPDYNSDGIKDCYKWVFNPKNPTTTGSNLDPDYIIGSTYHVYTNAGTYNPNLTVCDDIGCCTASQSIHVGTSKSGELPLWKEISPF